MSEEKILEVVERQDKYYILGFIKGLKANIDELQQENEQLKARLELFENGVYFSRENDRLEEENDKLKEQLENKYSKTETLTNEVLYEENTKLINQQQEFIKYLEDFISKTDYEVNIIGNYLYLAWSNAYKKILQKYKEIIGNDINVGSNGGNKDE